MKKIYLFIISFFVSQICFSNEMIKFQEESSERVYVNIVPGIMWEKRKPQCAVWICNSEFEYLDTLYVTKSAAEKKWKFSPKEGRPESLPVWYFSTKLNPSEPEQKFDAMTSATPKNSVTASSNFTLEKGEKYHVMAEVNQSFDYNDEYTKRNSGVNGQPSVIYAGDFTVDGEKIDIELRFVGTGSNDGSHRKIETSENNKITSAKEIIKHIFVTVK